MQHIIFEQNDIGYNVAVLVKSSAMNKKLLTQHYIDPLVQRGLKADSIISFDLVYGSKKKPTAALRKSYLEDLLPILQDEGIEYLMVADSEYFKTLTGAKKVDPFHGYVNPCKVKNFEHLKIILCPNYQGLFYNPDLQTKIDLALDTLVNSINGTHVDLGTGIIKSAEYITDVKEAGKWLEDILHTYAMLTCDVETYSLKFWKTGIGTVGFSWDDHNGVVFDCDQAADEANKEMRALLKAFFIKYTGTLIYHGASFDLKIIINTLFMDNLLDEPGKQYGIEVMTNNFDCTKLITYLATNSTSGNTLGLKANAHEFAGNYALNEINDITQIPRADLMEYNLVDCLSTFYVYNKNYPIMVADEQLEIYETIMKPSIRVLLQVELTGMPLDMEAVKFARKTLEADIKKSIEFLNDSPVVDQALFIVKEQEQKKANAKLKVKQHPISHFDYITFNPNSPIHVPTLLHDYIELPVFHKTAGGDPSTAADSLKHLKNHTDNQHVKDIIDAIMNYLDATKILSTFVSAFEHGVLKDDGHYYLHGNFNVGGTVSGRLSSSEPNLQNIPSTGSKYAKLIKHCFKAPPGYLFMGADFDSLEDKISALTTRDRNKLKVYTDGFDGHCLRAYYYFKDRLIGITEDVDSINSIKEKYPEIRQESKVPTFALTYGGTHYAITEQAGIPTDEAKAIEANYHEMYKESDEWIQHKLVDAADKGYATVAFGLRVRTPILSKCFMNSVKTPYEAKAESRTVGNAYGQSYGLLNNRAGIELQERCFASTHRYDILPMGHIHDAQYFIVKDDINTVSFLNEHLVDCMAWQELPELQHDLVKLSGGLSLFYPDWAKEYAIPVGLKGEDIRVHIREKVTL